MADARHPEALSAAQKAAIKDAVARLPTDGPALETFFTLHRCMAEGPAAWREAASAGVYEQLVRYMNANSGDAEALIVPSKLLGVLHHAGCEEPGYAEAVNASGAVRAVSAALRTHRHSLYTLFAAAAEALHLMVNVLECDATAACELGAPEVLLAGLPLALRTPEPGNVTHTVDTICGAVMALLDEEDVMAARLARLGRRMLCDLAAALMLRCPASTGSTRNICTLLMVFTTWSPVDEVAAASSYISTSLQTMLQGASQPNVQYAGWSAFKALLNRDEAACARAVADDLVSVATQSLERLAQSPLEQESHDNMFNAMGIVCDILRLLITAQTLGRDAVSAVAVASVAALRLHGTADHLFAVRALALMGTLVMKHQWSMRLVVAEGGLVAVVSAMEAHPGVLGVYVQGMTSLAYLVITALSSEEFGRSAAEKARRLADTGVIEVLANALRTHVRGAEAVDFLKCIIDTLAWVCSGAANGPNRSDPWLQPCVAARAARAGVGAAITAAMARAPAMTGYAPGVALAAAVDCVPAPRACDGCGTVEAPKLMLCARCRTARFCGAACQRAAWAEHKKACVPPK